VSDSGLRHGAAESVPESVIHGLARVVLDSSPSAVVAVDEQGTIRYVNGRVAALFGYQPAEVLGQPVEMLVPSVLLERHVRHRAEYAEKPFARPMGTGAEFAGLRRDGSEFPVDISLTPVTTDAGHWVVAGVADLTARHDDEARIVQLSRAYRTLAHTNQAAVRSTDEVSLFTAICRISVEEGGYLGAWIGQPDSAGRVVPVARAGALDSYIDQVDIAMDPGNPSGRGPTAVTLRTGMPYYSSDFMTDATTAPWHELGNTYGIRASATMPLTCGGKVIASLSLYSELPAIFTAEMRGLLEGMASNVSSALDGFRAQRELAEVAAHRNELLQRLVAAQEHERARIAADVHDDSVQALAAVDLRLGLLQRRIRDVAPELNESVSQLQATLTGATERLRQLLFDLEPSGPGVGVADAIREAAAHIFDGVDVSCEVVGETDVTLAPGETSLAVRIAKEALGNARKHSGAASVQVNVQAVGQGVEISVADDGVGADPLTVTSPPGHRGLATMRDRAEIAGGWCRLERNASGGLTVRFWFPTGVSETAQPTGVSEPAQPTGRVPRAPTVTG
jgi:PAS domain S-box-containing protein